MNNLSVKQEILNTIKDFDKIVITRHIRPDGDAVGSTLGLAGILRLTFPEKDVRVIGDDHTDYVAFLGDEDEADDSFYDGALAIVLDTGTMDRISNSKIQLASKMVKIDHHIDIKPYGDVSWVEDQRSSVCEMITDFWCTFKDELKIDIHAATCLFTGMVTDSGRFRFRETSGDTMRLAGALLDLGIDTDTLYAHLYLEDFDYFRFQSYVYDKMQITENGVAYIIVDKAMQDKFNLTTEKASTVISLLEGIKGCLIWLAFIENPDAMRVRLRSRFVTVSELAERYGGGGHACAAGATVHDMDELNALLADADTLLKDYKANNEGWL